MALADFDASAVPNYAYTAGIPLSTVSAPTPVLNPVGTSPLPLFTQRAGIPRLTPSGSPNGNGTLFPAGGTINLNDIFNYRLPNQTSPNQLFTSTRSAPVQGQIDTAVATHGANDALANQSLADFVKELKASRGAVGQAGAQEQNAVSQVYDSGPGGLQAQLAALNRQKTGAINMAAESAMNRAARTNSIRRLSAPNSSYLDRLFSQDLSGIATGAAGASADQGRADLQYLNDQRLGAVGRRQSIIDNIVNRNLLPAQAAASVEGNSLNNLGQLSYLNSNNNMYETPESAYARKLSFYQNLINQGY